MTVRRRAVVLAIAGLTLSAAGLTGTAQAADRQLPQASEATCTAGGQQPVVSPGMS
jgi:hypothetical protein